MLQLLQTAKSPEILAAEALQALGPVPCLVDIAPADQVVGQVTAGKARDARDEGARSPRGDSGAIKSAHRP